MAKDVITRFKLETTAYDSKLRDASKGLADYAKTATAAGKEFGKFTQSNVEAARALGNIAPSANNAKDKVKELVAAYNELFKAYDALTKEQQQSDFGKAMADSLGKLKTQIADAKQELYGMGDAMKKAGEGNSGLTSMLAVFGGNVLTKGVSMLTSELVGSVQQSIELAQQGEGIRNAFERLNKPGLLDNLKEATHGTVSELDLMKQAVKFDNFKLPLDQMGTLLAFAQQQAKDTGQSVDYMVDSIVTGLGRKSLPILDNLGLSAAEIRERMKESGDMTTAVASIIKDRMEAAGGYVETAADRAARATAKAQDAAEAFGRNAIPIAQEWAETWATLSQGAMTFANTLLGPVARSIRSIQGILNSDPMDRITGSKYNLFNGYQNPTPDTGLPNQRVTAPGGYVVVTDQNGKEIGAKHFDDLSGVDAWKAGLSTKSTRSGGSRGRNRQSTADMLLSTFNKANGKIDAASLMDTTTSEPSDIFRLMQQQHQEELKNIKLDSRADFEAGQQRAKSEIERGNESTLSYAKKQLAVADTMAGNLGNILSGLNKMGIELPEGLSAIVEGTQSIISIVTSIMTLVSIISTLTAVKSTPIVGWLLANGGIAGGARGRHPIHAATGTIVPGNNYSGDRVPALVNSGELILNRAQQGNIASQLQGGGMQNMNLQAIVTGEQLRFVLNSNSRRRGKGEYVTSTHQ
jgi:hypothetical protein